MKHLMISVLTLALVLTPLPAEAKKKARISGGGQGSFVDGVIDPWDLNGVDGDLDGDGDVDGSYWGVGVEIDRRSVSGHFVCAMWGNTDIYGLELMGVEGTVDTAQLAKSGRTRSVTLTGTASVDLGGCGEGPCFFEGVPYVVVLTEGDAGEATIQLTVEAAAFDGIPGDTVTGNGQLDLPIEQVVSGHIDIR